jgi:hypothetical protein
MEVQLAVSLYLNINKVQNSVFHCIDSSLIFSFVQVTLDEAAHEKRTKTLTTFLSR